MSTDSSLETRIARIEARHALNDLVANYFLRVDARTYESLADLFAGDASFSVNNLYSATGRSGLLEFWQRRISNYEFTYHYLHSHVITELGETSGTGITTGHAEHAINGTCVLAALRYDDHYACEAGVWRFKSRKLTTRYFLPWNEMAGKFREGAIFGQPKDAPR